ncbi:MAG: inositol monophosphatase family protein [Alphaproteobacteria bacterium]|nr:histidinol phosphatase [Rhodospirillaceae bacterium]MBT6509094.1 histidinol phosphatase [Rhodospirillaceae bacterium]MBT7613351.1 histidinol phosphatase [Rhodospirillaceae bacterium]MDG2480205.1 inositol monophosphatase family protein [Alphaproteobacteria bacterium]
MTKIDLERAVEIARRAAEAPSAMIAAAARAQSFSVEIKEDGSHLTETDAQAERMVRAVLHDAGYPEGAAILGEEEGEEEGTAPWRWVVDPIDGTHPFSRDIPVYSTLIALENRETSEILVGVAHLPGLGETFWASRGGGAFRDGQPIRVSERTDLYETMLSTGSPYQYRQSGLEHLHRRLFDATKDLRAFGDVYAHMAAARGALDGVFDPDLSLWDFAPTKVIVEEAGGVVLVRETGRGRGHDVLLGNPAIVEQLAELLEF